MEWHICVGNLAIIGSDNGLSPGRRQAIIWNNAGILFIEPLGTNFCEILFEMHTLSFNKMYLRMLSAKWRPSCIGLNVPQFNKVRESFGGWQAIGFFVITCYDYEMVLAQLTQCTLVMSVMPFCIVDISQHYLNAPSHYLGQSIWKSCAPSAVLKPKFWNEWRNEKTFWASNFALKPKKIFRRPDLGLCWIIVSWILRNKFQSNFDQYKKIYFIKNM